MNRTLVRALSLVLLLASTASAQLITTGDDSAARTPAATPPMPLSTGVNNGFGSQIGAGVTFVWDTDVLGNVSLDILGGSCQGTTGNPDTGVVYLDVDRSIGFASTSGFNDTGDRFRAAASGNGTTSGTADLTFAPTVTADYAIAFFNPDPSSGRTPEAHLYQLVNGGAHVEIGTLTAGQVGAMGCAALRIEGFTLADMSLAQGGLFRWIATVLNAGNAFRGNEFHGSTYAGANIGAAAFAMAMGDYNVFTSVGRVIVNEVDADTPSTDAAEFIELSGAAGVRLDGTVLTLFNGSGDSSYDAIDLDGGVTDAMGYYVVGSATVPNVDQVEFTTNGLQNGADGLGFYLGDASDFPNGTAATATNLVDAVVYDTNDGDDAGLLAALLLGGEPQLNEDDGTDKDIESNSRCPDGTGAYRTTSNFVPVLASPGAPNACPVCGNSAVEFGEDCDDGAGVNGTAASCCLMDCSFRAADEVCGAASGACDLDDTCDGAGTCVGNVEPATTECRASAGVCDVAETCDGTNPTCPVNDFEPSTTECRASADVCDVAETCTGGSATCPVDGFAAGTVECRASTGVCDPAETCSGTGAACPADMLSPTGTECRASAGACDVAEACDGASVDCPADALAGSSVECRAAAGACDVAETCSGSDVDCPADVLEPSTTECRASAGVCDVAESCTGSDADCPIDGFAASTLECRAAAGPCDVAESCTGSAAGCPTDMVAVDGTACENALVCDGAETCMSGTCTMGTALDCDDSDLCTTDSCGEPGGCDNAAIAGCCNVDGDCDDSDVCTADVCSGPGGTCSASPITDCCVADGDCDDGNDCTTDACDLGTNRCMRTPVAGCCTMDTDCDDSNACTTDTCNVATGECSNGAVAGCCLADGDCDDSNTCTMDTCNLSSNTCDNDAIAGCCTMDSDCDDGDECTTDTCDVGTAACSNEMIDGCGMDAGVDAGGMDAGADAALPDAGGDSATGDSGIDSGTGGSSGGGCGCAVPGQSPAPGLLTVLILGLVLRRRRD